MATKKQTQISQPLVRNQWMRERVFSHFEKPSLTEQSHAPGCDLKLIMQRYTQTGELPRGREGQILYGDAPDQENDLHAVLSATTHAEQAFALLPPEVREQYGTAANYYEAMYQQAEKTLDAIDEMVDHTADTEALAEGAEGTSEASQNNPGTN